jgi:hypothetical protein
VIWVAEGKSSEVLKTFFELFGLDACKRIQIVTMDMSAAYRKAVQENLPHAKIVFDHFHIAQTRQRSPERSAARVDAAGGRCGSQGDDQGYEVGNLASHGQRHGPAVVPGAGAGRPARTGRQVGDLKAAAERKESEYVIIGTLMSFGFAVITGFATMALLARLG